MNIPVATFLFWPSIYCIEVLPSVYAWSTNDSIKLRISTSNRLVKGSRTDKMNTLSIKSTEIYQNPIQKMINVLYQFTLLLKFVSGSIIKGINHLFDKSEEN